MEYVCNLVIEKDISCSSAKYISPSTPRFNLLETAVMPLTLELPTKSSEMEKVSTLLEKLRFTYNAAITHNEYEERYMALLYNLDDEVEQAIKQGYVVDFYFARCCYALSTYVNCNTGRIKKVQWEEQSFDIMQEIFECSRRFIFKADSLTFGYLLNELYINPSLHALGGFNFTGVELYIATPETFLEAQTRLESYYYRRTVLNRSKTSDFDKWLDELFEQVHHTLDFDEAGNKRNLISDEERIAVNSHLKDGVQHQLSDKARLYLACVKWCSIYISGLISATGTINSVLAHEKNRQLVVTLVNRTLNTYLNMFAGKSFQDAFNTSPNTLITLDPYSLKEFDIDLKQKSAAYFSQYILKEVALGIDDIISIAQAESQAITLEACSPSSSALNVQARSTNDIHFFANNIFKIAQDCRVAPISLADNKAHLSECNNRILSFFRGFETRYKKATAFELLYLKTLRIYADYYYYVYGIEEADYVDTIKNVINTLGMMVSRNGTLDTSAEHKKILQYLLLKGNELYVDAKRDFEVVPFLGYTEFKKLQKKVELFSQNLINDSSGKCRHHDWELGAYFSPFYRYFNMLMDKSVGYDWYYIEFTCAVGSFLNDKGYTNHEFNSAVSDAIVNIVTRHIGINNCSKIISFDKYDDKFHELEPIFCLNHLLCHIEPGDYSKFIGHDELYTDFY